VAVKKLVRGEKTCLSKKAKSACEAITEMRRKSMGKGDKKGEVKIEKNPLPTEKAKKLKQPSDSRRKDGWGSRDIENVRRV